MPRPSARRALCVAALAAGLVPATGTATPPGSVSFPARAAFVYPWYPETWRVGGSLPHFRPSAGFYDSGRAATVDSEIRALDYAHVQVGILSWWGPRTHAEGTRIPLVLARTASLRSSLRWALYYEPEGRGDPSVETIRADLAYAARYTASPAYARVNGRPVVFVYGANDRTCSVVERWAAATGGRWYVVQKVFPGYRDCPTQPDSWHQYAPAKAEDAQRGYSFSISPGFWKADEAAPRLRRSVGRWRREVRDMIASRAPWQLITTFDEWGEGTATESAAQWASRSGFGAYLDVLHARP